MREDPRNFSYLIFLPNNNFGHGQEALHLTCTIFVCQMRLQCIGLVELALYLNAEIAWVIRHLTPLGRDDKTGKCVTEERSAPTLSFSCACA